MRVLPLVLIAIAMPAHSSPAGQSAKTIPAKFHGEWAQTRESCNSRGGENVAGFTVSAQSIVYYEESVEVQQVRLIDGNTLSYTGKLVWADGEEPSSGTLRLSADGKRMLGGDASGDLVRCAG